MSSPLDRGALRRGLAGGDTTLGTFLGTGSPVVAEVCALSGLDWLLVDCEHGMTGDEAVGGIVAAVGGYQVPVLARIARPEPTLIGRVLDAGASGVMLPRITSAQQARAVLSGLHYPPRGTRGVASYNRAAGFGRDVTALDRAADEVFAVVQIETTGALAEVDEIAALDGVGVLFVGPQDLSYALGGARDYAAPAFQEALDRVVAAADRHGRAAGVLAPDTAAATRYLARGFRFVALASDAMVLGSALAAMVQETGTITTEDIT